MHDTPPGDPRDLIDRFLRGEATAVVSVNSWIDVAVRENARAYRSDWDDLRQEVTVRLFRNFRRSRFDGRSSLRTYVHSIAANACVDFSRRALRRPERPLGEAGEMLASKDARETTQDLIGRDVLEKILDGMKAHERELIDLIFVKDCSYAEAAARMGIREGAVKVRFHRLKDRIVRRCLDLGL